MVECLIEAQIVTGSNPVAPTILKLTFESLYLTINIMEIWKKRNTIEAKLVEHIRIPSNEKRCLELVITNLECNGKQTIKITLSEVEYETHDKNIIKGGSWYNPIDFECDKDHVFTEESLEEMKTYCDKYFPTLFHYIIDKAIEIENKI